RGLVEPPARDREGVPRDLRRAPGLDHDRGPRPAVRAAAAIAGAPRTGGRHASSDPVTTHNPAPRSPPPRRRARRRPLAGAVRRPVGEAGLTRMRQYSLLQAPLQSLYSKPFYRDVAARWRVASFAYLALVLAVCWLPSSVQMVTGASKWFHGE